MIVLLTLLMMLATSCGSDEVKNPITYDMPLNRADSIAMVDIYKALGYRKQPHSRIDFKNKETWKKECRFGVDRERHEYYIESITLAFESGRYVYFDFKKKRFDLPDAVGNMSRLKQLQLYGSIGVTIGNITAAFNCPLEWLYATYADISETDLEREMPRLSDTLKELGIGKSNLSGSQEWTKALHRLQSLILSENKYEGKVPDIYKLGPINVSLYGNNYTEMDWSYFTDPNAKTVPNLESNRLSGEIPKEVFDTKLWYSSSYKLTNQQEGYGFSNYNASNHWSES